MLDGSLPFQKHIKKWTKNTRKMSKPERRQRNVLSFSKHDEIYPQQAKKTKKNAKFFLTH